MTGGGWPGSDSDSIELEFASNVSASLALDRQKQLIGRGIDPLDLAAEILPAYEETVLKARVRAAGSGCGETKQAIEAYVRYQRMTQLLGVGDEDSPYARPIPERLFELERKLCWEEAYIRCRVTGDFR